MLKQIRKRKDRKNTEAYLPRTYEDGHGLLTCIKNMNKFANLNDVQKTSIRESLLLLIAGPTPIKKLGNIYRADIDTLLDMAIVLFSKNNDWKIEKGNALLDIGEALVSKN